MTAMDESSPDLLPDPAAPAAASPAPERQGMSRRVRAWLVISGVLVTLVLLMMLPGQSDPDAPPPSADGGGMNPDADGNIAGQDAPLHFTLKDLNGVDVNLASFKGKVILINFWATWCGPCKVEIPDLMELQEEHREGLVVLGIDVLDEFDRVKPFADQLKVNYPLLDANNRKDVEEAFGPMWGLPTSVIVDRDGKIFKKHSGIATKEQFHQYIESLL